MNYPFREYDIHKQANCKHECPIWYNDEIICDDCQANLEPTLQRLFYLISHLNHELDRIRSILKKI